jgi:D-alanyl-D-alanine carboxypeptidase
MFLQESILVMIPSLQVLGKTASLQPGDFLTLLDLLYGLLLPSCNDAAVIITKWAGE